MSIQGGSPLGWLRSQKAETVIKHLIRDYIPDRGVPSVVHSDNGPAYIAHIFQVTMAAFDVRTTTTTVYNPKSYTVEQFHRTMKRKLTALIHELDNEWDKALPATLCGRENLLSIERLDSLRSL